MTLRTVNIPPFKRPGADPEPWTFSIRLVGENDQPVALADDLNDAVIVGEGNHTVPVDGLTLYLTTQDSLPATTYWLIEVPVNRVSAVYRVQISAGAAMTWNELIGAGAPVDPADIWSYRMLPASAVNGQLAAYDSTLGYWVAIDPPPGTGDLIGPDGATDENIPLFDGPTGKLVKDSTKSLADIVDDVVAALVSTGRLLPESPSEGQVPIYTGGAWVATSELTASE